MLKGQWGDSVINAVEPVSDSSRDSNRDGLLFAAVRLESNVDYKI